MKYDLLVVGSGLYGAICAYRARQQGKSVIVIERRPHVGGNLYCEFIDGIWVHKYGPHVFHTDYQDVWEFMNSLVPFNHFRYCPLACYRGKLYHLPFNMNTFYELWGTRTPSEAQSIIARQRLEIEGEPQNLEEQAIKLVGREIYEKLIKGYTEKQWGRPCQSLPPFIIKRLPVRFYYDNNYFNHCFQGIPIGGYNRIFDKLLKEIEVHTETDFFSNRKYFENIASHIVYTGPIDRFFDFKYGALEYRTLRFEEERLPIESYQGNAGVNFTDKEHPYTRIIEHKYFEFGTQPTTVITREFSEEWNSESEPYYPINNEINNQRYLLYKQDADQLKHIHFGGRLAEYKYYDMHQIVKKALEYEL